MIEYRFRGSVHYHHEGEYGGMQADVVLKPVLHSLVAGSVTDRRVAAGRVGPGAGLGVGLRL